MDLARLKTLDLREFLRRHYGLELNGSGAARCPFHEDGTASFSVYDQGGRWAWKCHAGCGQGDVVDFVAKRDGLSAGDAIRRVQELEGLSGPGPEGFVRTHTYHDAEGRPVWRKVKLQDGTFRCQRLEAGAWAWGLAGIKPIPYRLDKIKDEPAVILCEGERDADTLARLGIPATSGPAGKDSWSDEITPWFKGKEIRIVYDVGQDRAARVAAKKLAAVCPHIFILTIPGKDPAKDLEFDITDYLNAFGTDDEKRDAWLGILAAEEKYAAPAAADPLAFLITGAALQTMDLQVEWTIEKIIPERSLTVLHSRGGLGKTWLALQIAKAVSQGTPIFGLQTRQKPVVYVDFENPLPLLIDRVRRLEIRDVLFWPLSAKTPPPKLDSPDYSIYKTLPAGSLLIFDTFRAAFNGDENNSQDVAGAMGHLKEIREAAFDILVIHHVPKGDERQYKGSTAIADLADHVLALFRTERTGDTDDIPDPGAVLCLTSEQKTRFEPARIFLTLDPTGQGFSLADDPIETTMQTFADFIAGEGAGKNQSEIITWARTTISNRRRDSLLTLLQRGEREGRWRSFRQGYRRIYESTKS